MKQESPLNRPESCVHSQTKLREYLVSIDSAPFLSITELQELEGDHDFPSCVTHDNNQTNEHRADNHSAHSFQQNNACASSSKLRRYDMANAAFMAESLLAFRIGETSKEKEQ